MLIHRDEAADLRVVVSCPEVNQAGVGVEALAGVEVGDGRAAALAEGAERIIAVGLRRGAVGHEPRRALAVAVDLPRGGAVAVADQGACAVGRVEVGADVPGAAVFLCAFGDDFVVGALGVEQVVRFAAGAAVAGEALDAPALGVVAVFDALAAAFDLDQAVVAVPLVARGARGFRFFAEVYIIFPINHNLIFLQKTHPPTRHIFFSPVLRNHPALLKHGTACHTIFADRQQCLAQNHPLTHS